MKQNFIKWLENHKDEYDIKIIKNPSKEQKEQSENYFQDFKNWLNELKNNAKR